MFGKKKRESKQRIAVQVAPTLDPITVGCYTDHVYQCIKCKSVMYIAPNSTIKCEVCGGNSLLRFDAIFQWKYGKWNTIMHNRDHNSIWHEVG